MADEQIQELRVRNDQICEELGLPKFQKDEQWQSRGMSNAEYYTADRGESWKFELMRVIDECMRCAGSREEFLILLRSEGYDATWTDSRKNITYTTPEGRKCRDSKLHIEKYLKENMEAEFGYRTENDNTRNVDAAQKADGRGATAGTQRDGHGAELERAARNAGQAVSAADAVGCKPENAPNERGRTGDLDRDADECRGIFETGWEPEREVFFQLQGADREYEALPDRDPERYEEAAFEYGAGDAEENPDVRVDLDYSGDLLRGAVRLGRAVEQMKDDAPTHDGTTTPPHIDSKRRKSSGKRKPPSVMPRMIMRIGQWNSTYKNSLQWEAERKPMKKDWEIYRDTGILGGYIPEQAKLRRTEDGEVATVFRDTTTRIEGDCIAKQREMLIGSKRFCITSVFPAEPSATATDKLLAYIDAELKKEAHSA